VNTSEKCKDSVGDPKYNLEDIVVLDELFSEFGFESLVGIVIDRELVHDEGDESGNYPSQCFWDYSVFTNHGIFQFEEQCLTRLDNG
jgi:hypothetical protein